MTLCLAVACQENSEPRIILCSDTRLDYGPLGSSQRTVKADVLGQGWAVLWAGQPNPVQELIDELQPRFQHSSLSTRSAVIKAVESALKAFRQSRLYSSDTQLIVSGFVRGSTLLLNVSGDSNGELVVTPAPVFTAIGEGFPIAFGMLNYRQVTESMPIEQVTYCVYEAKRISEQVGSVGPFTVLIWQAPGESTMPISKANLAMLTAVSLSGLETLYRRIGPQPLPNFEKFPPEFFAQPSAI